MKEGGRPDIYRELSMTTLAALRGGDLAKSEVLSRLSQQLFDASKRPATDGKKMSQHHNSHALQISSTNQNYSQPGVPLQLARHLLVYKSNNNTHIW